MTWDQKMPYEHVCNTQVYVAIQICCNRFSLSCGVHELSAADFTAQFSETPLPAQPTSLCEVTGNTARW